MSDPVMTLILNPIGSSKIVPLMTAITLLDALEDQRLGSRTKLKRSEEEKHQREILRKREYRKRRKLRESKIESL